MTLISSLQGPDVGFLGISDVLISRESTSAPLPVPLPFRPEPIKHVAGNSSIAGVAQKTVLSGRTAIQWAGNVIAAQVAIGALLSAGNQGQDLVDVPHILENIGLLPHELTSIAIIYHYAADGLVKRYNFNCQNYVGEADGEIRVSAAGTGVFSLIDDLSITYNRHDNDFYWNFLGRALFQAFQELSDNSNYDCLFGGWFEITEDQDEGFTKLPYAIKFWTTRDELLNPDLPMFYSWYENWDLFICRTDFRREAGGDVGSVRTAIHRIGDFLGRSPVHAANDSPPLPKWCPQLICHVVMREDSDRVSFFLDKDAEPELTYDHEPESGGWKLKWSPTLFQKLVGKQLPTLDFELKKLSSLPD